MSAINVLTRLDGGYVDESQKRWDLLVGLAVNQLAIDAVKAQRLRVFRAHNYVPRDCTDDDDEFEAKTLYFLAYLAPSASTADAVQLHTKPNYIFANRHLCADETAVHCTRGRRTTVSAMAA